MFFVIEVEFEFEVDSLDIKNSVRMLETISGSRLHIYICTFRYMEFMHGGSTVDGLYRIGSVSLSTDATPGRQYPLRTCPLTSLLAKQQPTTRSSQDGTLDSVPLDSTDACLWRAYCTARVSDS